MVNVERGIDLDLERKIGRPEAVGYAYFTEGTILRVWCGEAEAREVLRQKYLEADVGITGANFLIAETGSSVIVTNEGNGDLTQVLPKVHIVVASLEKVVPTLEDATTILRVLARSATGQEFSTYTTFSTGPKRAEDPDADVVAAGQQPGAGRRAHRLSDVKIGEPPPLLGHLVEIRRRVVGGAEGPDVGVAHVVHEDHHDIRRPLGPGRRRSEEHEQQAQPQGSRHKGAGHQRSHRRDIGRIRLVRG